MEKKYTPGPWTLVKHMSFKRWPETENDNKETRDTADLMGFAGSNGARVCWFGNSETYYPTQGDEPSEPDAHLISAAPDLLEALEGLMEAAEFADMNQSPTGYYEDNIAAARAAIRKAYGEDTP